MEALSRKTVTILFSDVVGSTPLAESLDPEAVRALMGQYFDRMSEVIARHGGSVEKYIGDAVMAVFGVPSAHEDDALRAVRAATEMRLALAELNRGLRTTIAVRTGVNTGEVVVGAGPTLVTGDPVNTAKRLEQAAASGEILVGAATYRLVRDAVIGEPVGRLELKGKADGAEAWRIVAVLPDAPGRARRFDTPLVGREEEFAMLRQAFDRALARRTTHLFTMLGPAGVGKSRLARDFARSVAADATLLLGRCLPYGDGITYWPLRDVVRALGDIGTLVGDADAAVVRATLGDEDSAASPDETSRAFLRLVESAARSRPIVLVIEDIHWAETVFLDLVEYIADAARDAPILIVCLARPELLDDRPQWSGGKLNATTVLLDPLDQALAERLLNVLGGDKLDAATRERIIGAAEGNPLFLEEIAAMVVDEGAAVALPPTVQALLVARLELLPHDERASLAAAAVVGRFFARDALAAVAGDGALAALPALERKDLIRSQQTSFADDGFRFRHILIRDAAYEALPKSVRAEWHVRVADWLSGAAGAARRREADELVAWHLEQAYAARVDLGARDAELGRRAFAALVELGRSALGRGDAPAAETLLERALALPRELDALRVEARFDLAAALLERGKLQRAEEAAAQAAEEATVLDDDALAARASVELLHVDFAAQPTRWVERAVPTAQAALPALEQAGDDAGLARAWLVIVTHDYVRCQVGELWRSLEQALRYARATGARRHVGELLVLAVRSLVLGPEPVDVALARCDRLAAEGGDEGVIHGVRAALYAMAGRADEARRAYRAGHALLEELGRTRLLAVQRYYAATAELLAGDRAAAERELRESVRTLEAIGDTGTLSTVASLLAVSLHASGSTHEARTWAERSRQTAPTIDLLTQVQWRVALARVSEANPVDLAEEAVRLAATTDAVTLQADALLCLRDVLSGAGRAEEATDAAARAAALYRAKGHTVGVELAGVAPLAVAGSGAT